MWIVFFDLSAVLYFLTFQYQLTCPHMNMHLKNINVCMNLRFFKKSNVIITNVWTNLVSWPCWLLVSWYEYACIVYVWFRWFQLVCLCLIVLHFVHIHLMFVYDHHIVSHPSCICFVLCWVPVGVPWLHGFHGTWLWFELVWVQPLRVLSGLLGCDWKQIQSSYHASLIHHRLGLRISMKTNVFIVL